MSVSVHLNGVQFLSSKEAARVFGYTSDYVSRLARQGKVSATRIGHQWFVDPTSLDKFLVESAKEADERIQKLRVERKQERVSFEELGVAVATTDLGESTTPATFDIHSHLTALAVVVCGFFVALLPYLFVTKNTTDVATTSLTAFHEVAATISGIYRALSVAGDTNESLGANIVSAPAVQEAPKPAAPALMPYQVRDGLVVMPATEMSVETASAVAASFSDPVRVTPDAHNPNIGVIEPVFKDGKTGEAYRYVMVPVAHPP